MTELFQNKYRIESSRLKDWDYSSNGAYYVTICTKNRECVLSKIIDARIQLSSIGKIVKKYWMEIAKYFETTILDEFVILPDHIHGIIIINNERCRDGVTPSLHYRQRPTLGQIVGYFKYQSTKSINEFHNMIGVPFWQPRFYESIIRNEKQLNMIREYITNNPINWKLDKNNHKRHKI